MPENDTNDNATAPHGTNIDDTSGDDDVEQHTHKIIPSAPEETTHDSEAETEKLSDVDAETDEDAVGSSIQDEESETEDASGQRVTRASVEKPSHGENEADERKDERANGRDSHGSPSSSTRRRKSSGAASNAMSWSSSAQFKEDTRRSPTEATSSPRPRNAFSPSVASGRRDRSNSIPESRKRKARDEGHIRNLEPPRQRHKTDGAVRELSNPRQQQPQSSLSSTTAASRQHRRSASTQSAVQGSSSTQGRKRRDASNLIISTHDHRAWSSHSSSDEDSSPRRPSQPKLQHMRLKRSSHRSLTSPARTMPKKDTDKFGATKLAREAERGDLKSVIAAYNEKNDDLNRPDFAGFTPLQKAALNGYDDVVKFLIDKGCDTSCQSGDRDTPLIDAAENGHIEVVRLLLRQGKVNPHHQNKKGQRAIDVLKDGSDFEELEKELKEAMLREADTSANKEEDKANLPSKQASSLLYNEYNVETMKDKAAEGNVQLVGELLESRVKPNIACGIAAARGGHDDILSLFLAEGLKADPDPAKHSETYMTVAIGRGHLRVIELLLNQENFDPTRENREGLNYWQLAEQRRGPKWEQERSLLKERYDAYLNKRSPNRSRKHAPASSNSPPPARTKLARRSSPQPTDRSLSPVSAKHRRSQIEKQSVEAPRTKMSSNKEYLNQRDYKRRRRVVDEESSEEDTKDNRLLKRVVSKDRAASEGEHERSSKLQSQKVTEQRKSSLKPSKQSEAKSDDSDVEARARAQRTGRQRRSAEPSTFAITRSIQPTPDASSDIESRKITKGNTVSGPAKVKSERPDSPALQGRTDKQSSSRDFGAPSESRKPKPSSRTPSPVREARFAEARRKEEELQREADKARLKKEEDEARQKEEATRKREEAEARKREEAEARRREEAEARRREEAEAREREEAEARRREEIRLQQEEDRRREIAEQQRVARLEAAAARIARLEKLPPTLKSACEKGLDRPVYFDNDTIGIIPLWFPVYVFPSQYINPTLTSDDMWMHSFQCVGILGLPELDISEFFPTWEKYTVTDRQRDHLVQSWDMAPLAQELQYPVPGMASFNCNEIENKISETRGKFKTMNPLYWIKFSDFERELRDGGRDLAYQTNGTVKSEIISDEYPTLEALEANPNGSTLEQTLMESSSRERAKRTRDQLRAHKFQPVQGIHTGEMVPKTGSEVKTVNGVKGLNGNTSSRGTNGASLKPRKSLKDLIRDSTSTV